MAVLSLRIPEHLRALAERVAADRGTTLDDLLTEALTAFLSSASDPVSVALANASEDDEPTTPDEDEGAEEAWQEYLRGESVPVEELLEKGL